MEKSTVALFTPEFAISQDLHTYSGGLGVYAGGFGISAKKLGIPLVCVTLMPRQGYYDQYIDGNKMGIRFVNRYYDDILQDTGITFPIIVNPSVTHSPRIWVKVWRLPEERYNCAPVFFLDTDIEMNDSLSRLNTMQLYGGSRSTGANVERMIVQSIILGKGGVQALQHLKIPVGLYHLNESHVAFAALELLHSFMKNGMPLEEAIRATRSHVVFTTHTPVHAGNPEYDLHMVMRLYGTDSLLTEKVFERIGGSPFNMAAACMRLARKTNAVSQKHLITAKKLWHWVQEEDRFIAITNGGSQDFWQHEEFRHARTPEQLAKAKLAYTRLLLRHIQETTGRCLSENIFTIAWARRFAEYKRPKLLFYNREWISNLLRSNTIQTIIAGKPHPDDHVMIDVWNELLGLSEKLPNLVVLPGYELALSQMLKAGVHLWLNTPRSPDEACGTSGMSAAMMAARNMSIPDGWMYEANQNNHFIFGSTWAAPDQDAFDAERLRMRLEQAIDLFYHNKKEWWEKALSAKLEAETQWTSDRMVLQYLTLLYEM